jgi:hypothetical protein
MRCPHRGDPGAIERGRRQAPAGPPHDPAAERPRLRGTTLSAWPTAKHFTSWLCLAPANKISGGKVLSSRTRHSGNRAAALLRLAATTVGRTDTALGAFYRRLSGRVGKAKAVTATARKIAVLFYNALRHEDRYRRRVLANLPAPCEIAGLHPQARRTGGSGPNCFLGAPGTRRSREGSPRAYRTRTASGRAGRCEPTLCIRRSLMI